MTRHDPDFPTRYRKLPVTVEAVADALSQYETGGMCHYGQTCGLCDCGRSDQTAEQRREWDEHQLDRARAVLALFSEQRCAPSEDEIAEALHADACPEDPDDGEACTCSDYCREAQIVRALFAGQPTIAEVRARALREAAAVARLDRVGGLAWIARAVEAWLNARAGHIAAAAREAEGGAR